MGFCQQRRDERARSIKVLSLLCVIAFFEPCSILCQRAATEYEVKAAFVYNFAKFVEWPDDAFADDSSPMVLGVIGESPIQDSLDWTIKGKTAGGRPLIIRRLSQKDDLRNCHILFVCASERKQAVQILAAVSGSAVLTVSDVEGFLGAGGMINLVMEKDHVRFLIRASAATRVRLKISSKLLALSRNPVD